MTRIYIAGAWIEQYTRARLMVDAVRKAGLKVTHDWTVPEGDVCMCGCHRSGHHGSQVQFDGYFGLCRTCPQPRCMGFNGIGPGSDSLLTREYRLEHSELELAAVMSAEIFWLLAPHTQVSSGSWVELGAALMARRFREGYIGLGVQASPVIIVSGPKNKRALFTEKADKLFETDKEALARVLELQRALVPG